MMAVRLALRNLIGAGLRTWLNVIVLSFAFVVIIWHKGLLDGWHNQAKAETIRWEAGGGQLWHESYDPLDPFTLEESHGVLSEGMKQMVSEGKVTPVLITQGTIYPAGRMLNILIKGIDPSQKIVAIPSEALDTSIYTIPAVIGSNMAASARLKKGDVVTLRWRDRNGAFDASEVEIVGVFHTAVPSVDGGQIWIPLERLRNMMLLPGEATLLVLGTETPVPAAGEWIYKDLSSLLSELDDMIKTKTAGGSVLWGILLLLAMLAVFDTQVLSIFRRQKEIGTWVALGMTRMQVVGLFTTEGAMHSVLAAALGALYAVPLLALQSIRGLSFPVEGSDYGISMPERIYPVYSLKLVLTTIVIVFLMTVIVSYWPSRKIARMKPTDALRGKVQ